MMMRDILFIVATPCFVYGVSLGFFYLGRALVRWVLAKRKKDRF